MEQHPCTHVAVPVAAVGGRRHLAEVEADDVLAGLADAVEQVHQLLVFQASWHGRARVGTELRVEGVDVDGEVDLFGQGGNHLVHNGFPCRSFVHTATAVAVEEDLYPIGLTLGQGFLLVAVVADADLHELLHIVEFQRVVEDGGVRVFEALEGLAQVAVGVGVKDAVFHTYTIKVLVVGEGTAVVATQKANDFALLLPIGDALAQPGVFLLGSGLDAGVKLSVFLGFIVDGAFIQGVDDVLADGSQLVVQLAQFLRKFIHPDAFLPEVGVVVVAEVDLQGSLHDGGRTVDGATVVARGEFPFDGYDDDLRLFGGAGQAVDAGIGHGCGVGVKGVFHC